MIFNRIGEQMVFSFVPAPRRRRRFLRARLILRSIQPYAILIVLSIVGGWVSGWAIAAAQLAYYSR